MNDQIQRTLCLLKIPNPQGTSLAATLEEEIAQQYATDQQILFYAFPKQEAIFIILLHSELPEIMFAIEEFCQRIISQGGEVIPGEILYAAIMEAYLTGNLSEDSMSRIIFNPIPNAGEQGS